MKTEIDVPEYNPATGIYLQWDDGFEISVRSDGMGVVIIANAAGLRSLARHLLVLAQEHVPANRHIHLDDRSALEDGSMELILQRA